VTPLAATELVLAAVKSRLDSLGVAFTVDGESFEPPTDAPWARVAVRDLVPRGSSHGPVGHRTDRERGLVTVQCFAPQDPDNGQAESVALAQQVREVFRGVDLGSAGDTVTFMGARIQRIGTDRDWYLTNAIGDFEFNETF
jgi:hypothetical protein